MIIGTPYDFAADGYAYRNYMAAPQEWYNLFKISWQGPPGIYRLVVPLRPDEPPPPYPPRHAGEGREGAALATAQRKLQRFNPRAASYEIVFYDSYTVAQRVAASFRKGRVRLAGDSAHLNSPIGAMGMNSGIHDAVNLAANLIRVLGGEESDAALDRYVRHRPHGATPHVQTPPLANKQNTENRNAQANAEHVGCRRARSGCRGCFQCGIGCAGG